MKNIKAEKKMASGFRRKLLLWYDKNRRDLPWRRESDPYRIWLSEVMLQQTRVEAATPYYHRFLAAYPDLCSLADAGQDEVLKLWEGLGYYSRARNFLQAVREVRDKYGGSVPQDPDQFGALKGVGDYTRAAVCSIAFGAKLAVVDGNVVRVCCRMFAIEDDPSKAAVKKQIQGLARDLLDTERPGDFNQALMELGALICIPRAPRCGDCPVAGYCAGLAQGRVAELPLRKPKKELPRVSLAAAVITRSGKCLVRRRENDGLLASLWEFPNVCVDGEDGREPDELLAELLGGRVCLREKLMELSHTFSHLRWDIAVFCAEAEINLPESAGRWAGPQELAKMAFPAVYHPLVDRVKDSLEQ
ncbi:MAG: A/G-specific adenine glycosylase [Bacillota bacterium]|nr:A/G-specific adenine glycosylase [Bacillota bacterium]MDW7682750.1 A/G-specific adenine glycosylase [Bacillota bacterium]